MRTASMKALVDAPPSSPEFIIKKPHDETRHRSKRWRPLEVDIAPRTINMETVAQGTSKRVTRTYSKRQNPGSNSNPSQRPVERQKAEPSDDLPPLPPASDAPKSEKKPPSTIDGYFISSTSASSGTRRSGPSSDSVFSGDGEAASPPSSPPARRWTSPRKLKFRPSLLPISGSKEVRERREAVGAGELDKTAESSKRKRRRQLSGDVVSGNQEVGSTGPVSDERFGQSGLDSKVKRRRKLSTKDEGTEEVTGWPRSEDTEQRYSTVIPHGPISDSQQVGSTADTATMLDDADAGKLDTSVPNYTMPFSFYLKTANSEPRSSPPSTTTARKPRRTIQTTLNLSTKQPFKECKLCDTVYNPLHAVDVKLHQLRHARLLGEKDEGKKTGRGGRNSV